MLRRGQLLARGVDSNHGTSLVSKSLEPKPGHVESE